MFNTPLQDVSSIVTGQVLWDINHNFCQSWDRNGLFENRGNYNAAENLTQQRAYLTREAYQPNPAFGKEVTAQILRTYDNPRVMDIRDIYLQNIKKTVSYIYTENQYFRYPPLVDAFLKHWESIKEEREGKPLHWFAITNSSDDGIGAGTFTTNEMLKRLGRQDVMPNVARKVKMEELQKEYGNHIDKKKLREIELAVGELGKEITEIEEADKKGEMRDEPELTKRLYQQ